MDGTVFQFQARPGAEARLEQFLSAMDATEGERLRKAVMKASYAFKLDRGGYVGVAVFVNQEKYVANANDPAQDRWYRQFRELLQCDPTWNDGEIVAAENS
jgi:hypothetical protein